jgi:DNA adenine methylase
MPTKNTPTKARNTPSRKRKPRASGKNRPVLPPIRWVGGKRGLVDEIAEYVPRNIEYFIEPFVGGGSVFIGLINRGVLTKKTKIVVSDVNPYLIQFYKDIRDHHEVLVEKVSCLLDMMRNMKKPRKFYYIAVDEYNSRLHKPSLQSSIVFFFLSLTSFGGTYRTNAKGEYQNGMGLPNGKVPYIRQDRKDNLARLSHILKTYNVKLVHSDYAKILDKCNVFGKNGLIYLDPPYVPSSAKEFTTYFKVFDFDKFFQHVEKSKCKILMSNSFNSLTLERLKNIQFKIHTVTVRRGFGKGEVKETLSNNFGA